MEQFIQTLKKQNELLRELKFSLDQLKDIQTTLVHGLEKNHGLLEEITREALIGDNETKLRQIFQEKNPMMPDDELVEYYEQWVGSLELEDINNLLK